MIPAREAADHVIVTFSCRELSACHAARTCRAYDCHCMPMNDCDSGCCLCMPGGGWGSVDVEAAGSQPGAGDTGVAWSRVDVSYNRLGSPEEQAMISRLPGLLGCMHISLKLNLAKSSWDSVVITLGHTEEIQEQEIQTCAVSGYRTRSDRSQMQITPI